MREREITNLHVRGAILTQIKSCLEPHFILLAVFFQVYELQLRVCVDFIDPLLVDATVLIEVAKVVSKYDCTYPCSFEIDYFLFHTFH